MQVDDPTPHGIAFVEVTLKPSVDLLVGAHDADGTSPVVEAGAAPPFVLLRSFIVLIGALCLVAFLAEGAVPDRSAVFLTDIPSVTLAGAGWGYAAFAITMTGGRLIGDRIFAALGGQRILLLGGFLASLGFALIFASPSSMDSTWRLLPGWCRCCSPLPAARRTCPPALPSPRS